jgi:hypothetical protein
MMVFSSARAVLVILLVSLAVVAGMSYGIWWLMSQVPLVAARIWAIVATAGMPLCLWLGLRIGKSGMQAWVHGVDTGLEQVTKAAAQISQAGAESASLRGQTARTIREATQPMAEAVIELPKLDAHYQVMEALPSGEEVEI